VQDCDFIPTQYREAGALRKALKLRASCVGMLIAIMALWVVANHHRLSSAQAMVAEVERQEQQVRIHLAEKQRMEAERAVLESHQRLIEQLEAGIDLAVVFSDISRRMPDTVVLTAMTANCPALARYATEEAGDMAAQGRGQATGPRPSLQADRQPSAAPSPVPTPQSVVAQPPSTVTHEAADVDRITLIGIAREIPDVIAFAAALEGSRLFNRVQMEMKEPVVWAGRKAQQFEIRGDLARQVGGRP
jgi:Tfp pilus assembly protein PilN